MPTRKKGGAKKTINVAGTRGRKANITSDVGTAVEEIVLDYSEEEVFMDVMILLDKLDPISRTRTLSRVTSTLLESKKEAAEKAKADYEAFSQFVTAYTGEPVNTPVEDLATADGETKAVSKYE